MTTRHDATPYCHNEFDHCLDRLRAAISTHLHTLHEHGLGDDAEIILVEWNPCTADSNASHCDRSHRDGRGFLSVAEAVKRLVIPSLSKTPVRVLTVSQEIHDNDTYNPTNKNFLEFIAKNVGARRARGEHLLFTNPDNIFSAGLGHFFGKRHLREDTVYTSYLANLYLDIPVSKRDSISPLSMLTFAQRNFERSKQQKTNSISKERFHRTAKFPPASDLADASLNPDDDEPFFATDRRDLPHLHRTAAGDFLLASRNIVEAVRGYPECGVNVFVDSLMVVVAAAHGYGNLVLGEGCEVLHQKHQCHNACLTETDPKFQNPAFQEAQAKMLDLGSLANIRPANITLANGEKCVEQALDLTRWNDLNWGLAHHVIPETRLWSSSSPSCAT